VGPWLIWEIVTIDLMDWGKKERHAVQVRSGRKDGDNRLREGSRFSRRGGGVREHNRKNEIPPREKKRKFMVRANQ